MVVDRGSRRDVRPRPRPTSPSPTTRRTNRGNTNVSAEPGQDAPDHQVEEDQTTKRLLFRKGTFGRLYDQQTRVCRR